MPTCRLVTSRNPDMPLSISELLEMAKPLLPLIREKIPTPARK
jgi:hypothetical protein